LYSAECLVLSAKYEASKLSTKHLALGTFLLLCALLTGCDRGATEQVQAAQRFADAVSRNDLPARDSMIATGVFKRYFDNAFVSRDFFDWMRTIYDTKNNKFFASSRADVDRDLKTELAGGLLRDGEIEETGMVKVNSPNPGDPAAYFWMVKQKGRHWAVAIVTKGESVVNFK
jgi:hypothetical protein